MKRKRTRGKRFGFLFKIAEKLLSFKVRPPFCTAIITAAGSGTRMGGVSKQLLNLEGKPVLLYSVEAFHACDQVKEIIISAKKEEMDTVKALIEAQGYEKSVKVVCGGQTRQESVANAFYSIHKKSTHVAIHDGARPLIRTEDVKSLYRECFRYGAVSAGSPVTDSIKKVNAKGFIEEDVDREALWAVQTPQVFSCDIYRAALAMAKKDSLSVTDDNALVTHAGFAVKLVSLPIKNIKLTTPEDPAVVAALLRERRNQI